MVKLRENKINTLADVYHMAIQWWDADDERWGYFNQCIEDTVGITGLAEVKKRAWKHYKQ